MAEHDGQGACALAPQSQSCLAVLQSSAAVHCERYHVLVLYTTNLQLTIQLRCTLQTQTHMVKTIKPEIRFLFPLGQEAETSVTGSRNTDLTCLAGHNYP